MSIHNMPEHNREVRIHRLKKALAWVGVIIAGSLMMFGFGLLAITWLGDIDRIALLVFVSIIALLVWGCWGLNFLLTRH